MGRREREMDYWVETEYIVLIVMVRFRSDHSQDAGPSDAYGLVLFCHQQYV